MSKKEGRIYMCDPEKNTVCEKTSCYINGGFCRRTRHQEFAKDFAESIKEEDMNKHWEDWSDELCGRLAKQMGENDCSEFLMEAKAVNSDSCNGDSCPIIFEEDEGGSKETEKTEGY